MLLGCIFFYVYLYIALLLYLIIICFALYLIFELRKLFFLNCLSMLVIWYNFVFIKWVPYIEKRNSSVISSDFYFSSLYFTYLTVWLFLILKMKIVFDFLLILSVETVYCIRMSKFIRIVNNLMQISIENNLHTFSVIMHVKLF